MNTNRMEIDIYSSNNSINNIFKKANFAKFKELEEFVLSHRAIHHPLFDYIKECSKEGFTKKQYQIYRDNYLFRTMYTIPSIAYLAATAALHGDTDTLALVGKNLFEECGNGNPTKAHSHLLFFSHNQHGKTIFDLEPIQIFNVPFQSTIINEARLFIKQEKQLYQNKNYCIALGTAFAHETAAHPMLTNFYGSIFLPYMNYYTEEEYYNITEYFLIHTSGLELNHANNAKYSAEKMATNLDNLNLLGEGCALFLDSQSILWDGLYRELKLASLEGNRVLINPII